MEDMLFKLVDTENGMQVCIYPQSLVDNKWVVTSTDNPLLVDLKDFADYIAQLNNIQNDKENTNKELKEAVATMQNLIDNSN